MNSPDRIRYIFERTEQHSVITIMRSDWEALVRTDGSPTQIEALPPKISAVAKKAEIVAIAASGIANLSPGIDVVRKDPDDAPYIYNTDHYTVVESLTHYPFYNDLLQRSRVEDSTDLREELESWVWLIGPKRIDGIHWATEIPEYIRNAKKK